MSAHHDPDNGECDLNAYGPDAGGVKCTCDVDAEPVDRAPPAPVPSRAVSRAASPGDVVLTGDTAERYRRWRLAASTLASAEAVFRRAQAEYREAHDAFAAAATEGK